ncbi:MAG: hypothetical protein H6581_15050 [Bacteroidia bacterium]|nr:hypothetical protein [Bacteroidia bacterium]
MKNTLRKLQSNGSTVTWSVFSGAKRSAELYYQQGDLARAGKLWYFEQDKNPRIWEAIEAFRKSSGE